MSPSVTAAFEIAPPIGHPVDPAGDPPREPMGDLDAYRAGIRASRSGIDLADVVHEAFASWPGTSRQVCGAVACAALGWCAAEWSEE